MTQDEQASVNVDDLVAAARARLDAIAVEISKKRQRRAQANTEISLLLVEQRQLGRIVRASQPRRRKGSGE